ncbi:MAG: hypothetical protein A2231_04075 [Candidatus Firestonebacteria bacterium RIFOXYA2_FULL_40_8]|nr:MAG: hypothetical protein A2231_04075 [Candidatus Firestonebacteria bacterium RIFOXYA2_FULL_40_8]
MNNYWYKIKQYSVLTVFFLIILLALSIFRYLNIHSTYFDLGIYENIIYRIAFHQEWGLLFSGHVYPILLAHSLIYRIFPFTETLLILQALTVAIGSYPLYLLARKKLAGGFPLIVILCYFAYYGVEYNTVFDFHPDHIIIPILFFAFYFLDENKLPQFIVTCLIGMTVKEPFNLIMMMLGVYAIFKYKHLKSGIFIALTGLAVFIFEIKVIIPHFNPVISDIQNVQASKFGASVSEMIINLFVKPQIWLPMIYNKAAIIFVISVFLPLMFIPFLAPLELIIALPMFLILLSSGSSLHVGISTHYLACIIPPLFVAFIYGLNKIKNYKHLGMIIIGVGILLNIILSPSPISYTFWSGRSSGFSYKAYLPENRNTMIKTNIIKYIPANADVSVASQNSLNYSHLAKRLIYRSFPDQFTSVDYIVLDLKRSMFVIDKVVEKEFIKKFEFVKKTREVVYEEDGFYIFGSLKKR